MEDSSREASSRCREVNSRCREVSISSRVGGMEANRLIEDMADSRSTGVKVNKCSAGRFR